MVALGSTPTTWQAAAKASWADMESGPPMSMVWFATEARSRLAAAIRATSREAQG